MCNALDCSQMCDALARSFFSSEMKNLTLGSGLIAPQSWLAALLVSLGVVGLPPDSSGLALCSQTNFPPFLLGGWVGSALVSYTVAPVGLLASLFAFGLGGWVGMVLVSYTTPRCGL